MDTICWYSGLSERAVQYTLRDLEDHGVIRKTPNPLVLEAKVGDPRKRPQSYDIVTFTELGAGQRSQPPKRGERPPRGAKSSTSRGAKSAATLHPNRPVTVQTPEPSEKDQHGAADAAPSAALRPEDQNQNIDRWRAPSPRERGEGPHLNQDQNDDVWDNHEPAPPAHTAVSQGDVWDEPGQLAALTAETQAEYGQAARLYRIFDLIDYAVPGGMTPNEFNSVEAMHQRGDHWKKILRAVCNQRGYQRADTDTLVARITGKLAA